LESAYAAKNGEEPFQKKGLGLYDQDSVVGGSGGFDSDSDGFDY
jgi:hypothetical protein